MDGKWRGLAMAAGLLAAGCGGLAAAPVQVAERSPATRGSTAAEQVAAPAFAAGQQWTFRRIDLWHNEPVERFREEMLFPDGGRWLVRWTIFESNEATRRGSVTGEILDPASHGFADPRVTQGRHEPLRFPLYVGKQWRFDYSFVGKGGTALKIEQAAVVAGWETVQVPAGSFRALKVVHKGSYAAADVGFSWNGDIEETYWYAPAARRVVKVEYRDTKYGGGTWDHWRDELLEMKL